jgi:hypothetical protein
MSKEKEKTIQYWLHHVEAFRASGMTREAYCKRERLWVHKLDYWRRKFSHSGGPAPTEPVNQWVSLKINREREEKDPHIDLWVGRARIEIRPGFDSRLLAEIIQAMSHQC